MFDSSGKFNAIVKSGIIICSHIVIVAESLTTRCDQQSIWKNIILVDESLDRIGIKSHLVRKQYYRKYSMKFVAFQVFAIVSELIILFGLERNAEWTVFWCATIFSLVIIRTKHMQHVMFDDMLTSRFQAIKLELEQIVARSKDNMTIDILTELKSIKFAYGYLYEICSNLKSVCSFSQLTNLTQNFIQLSTDLYWMYSMLYRNQFRKIPGNYKFEL